MGHGGSRLEYQSEVAVECPVHRGTGLGMDNWRMKADDHNDRSPLIL